MRKVFFRERQSCLRYVVNAVVVTRKMPFPQKRGVKVGHLNEKKYICRQF